MGLIKAFFSILFHICSCSLVKPVKLETSWDLTPAAALHIKTSIVPPRLLPSCHFGSGPYVCLPFSG